MNQPNNVVFGRRLDRTSPAALLRPELDRYHLDAIPVRQASPRGQVVSWASGARWLGGDAAGTHDGIRDGAQTARVDMSRVVVQYCTAEDWIAAGNELPAT